jgi:hypothetical protein
MILDALPAVETRDSGFLNHLLKIAVVGVAENFGEFAAGPEFVAGGIDTADALKRRLMVRIAGRAHFRCHADPPHFVPLLNVSIPQKASFENNFHTEESKEYENKCRLLAAVVAASVFSIFLRPQPLRAFVSCLSSCPFMRQRFVFMLPPA